jgi:hypothetical protein
MRPSANTVFEALRFLCEVLPKVKIENDEKNIHLMGSCETSVDDIIKDLGLHEDQHPDVITPSTQKNSIIPLRVCPGSRLNTRE